MKTFILDTNILLSDPVALYSFEENNIVIPLIVLEELDRHKDRQDEVGRNARETVRKLTDITKHQNNIIQGVSLGENMGTLRILSIKDLESKEIILPPEIETDSGDNTIAKFCLLFKQNNPEENVVLVTKDLILQIKCSVVGITWENYRKFNVAPNSTSLYNGIAIIEDINVNDYYHSEEPYVLPEEVVNKHNLNPNQFLIMQDGNSSAIARFIENGKPLHPVKKISSGKLIPRNKEQEFANDLLFDDKIKLVTIVGKAGSGKAQPLYSKILTPSGWTTMGEIKPNDFVIGQDGNPVKVLSTHPQGEKDIYKVYFSDGTSTECCEEHLWKTKTQKERDYKINGKIRELKEIKNSLRYGKASKRNHSIPMINTVNFNNTEVPLDPYVLGILLGDGCLGTTNPSISFSTADEEIVANVQALLPKEHVVINRSEYGYIIKDEKTLLERSNLTKQYNFISPEGNVHEVGSITHFAKEQGLQITSLYNLIKNKQIQHKGWKFHSRTNNKISLISGIRKILQELNIFGLYSHEKFIPSIYKYNNAKIRLKLLQGLMDTDGFVSLNGHSTVYYSTSKQLALDVQELVWSFGGKATISNKQTFFTYKEKYKKGKPSFAVHISLPVGIIPFTLKRKLERFKPRTKYQPMRYVDKIEYVGKRESKCIYLDSPDHLYITDDYIVTHNTLISLAAGLEQVVGTKKKYKNLLVCRPVVPVGRDIGFLPGSLEEKLEPWLSPIKDNLRFLITEGKRGKFDDQILQDYFDQGTIEIEALTFIRGRSIANAFIIVDECQNISLHELRTILTRAGENSKIILTGDIEQIDTVQLDSVSNGLSIAVERFKSEKIAGHISLIKGERSELATIASNIL